MTQITKMSPIVSMAGPTVHPTNLGLTQVAVIAALCCAGHICMVVGGGGCCMLLLHPVPTSADAGRDLCTLCPGLCTLHPDLWILCLWCSLLSTGANIPLAQVVVATSCNLRSWCFFIQPLVQIVHLHTWWHHPLQLALLVLFHPSTGANTALAPGQHALCGGGQWWWYVAACGGGGIYI